jgi:hypothetical protein
MELTLMTGIPPQTSVSLIIILLMISLERYVDSSLQHVYVV